MNISKFIDISDFTNKNEIEKARLLIFFEMNVNNKSSFSGTELLDAFSFLGFAKPNSSRFKSNLKNSKSFFLESGTGKFKLNPKDIILLNNEFPDISRKSEEVISQDSILPIGLYSQTRGFIENICMQINASYENNIFDGCAILMRRLIEILLILGYKSINREEEILEESGSFKSLSYIVKYTNSKRVFGLTKDTYEILDDFRELGNFSAHKIQYNCKKGDISKLKMKFRVAVEELLYASKLKK